MFVIGKRRSALLVQHTRTGALILGTYDAAAVIIKLKRTANPYEVIAEAGMR